MTASHAGQRGMTLVEILLALGVTALVSLGAMSLLNGIRRSGKSADEALAFREIAADIGVSLSDNEDCIQALENQRVRTWEDGERRIAEDQAQPKEIEIRLDDARTLKAGSGLGDGLRVASITLALEDDAVFPGLVTYGTRIKSWHGLITIKAEKIQGGGPLKPFQIPLVVAAENDKADARIRACYSNPASRGMGASRFKAGRAADRQGLVLESRRYSVFARAGEKAAVVCPKGTVLSHAQGYRSNTAIADGDSLTGEIPNSASFYPVQLACAQPDECDPDHPDEYISGTYTSRARILYADPAARADPRGCVADGDGAEVGCAIDCIVMTTPTTLD